MGAHDVDLVRGVVPTQGTCVPELDRNQTVRHATGGVWWTTTT